MMRFCAPNLSPSDNLHADQGRAESSGQAMTPPLSERLEIPEGLYSMVKIPTAARALRLPARQLRAEVDAGRVPCRQPGGRCGVRYILTADIVRLALAYGVAVDWDALAALE